MTKRMVNISVFWVLNEEGECMEIEIKGIVLKFRGGKDNQRKISFACCTKRLEMLTLKKIFENMRLANMISKAWHKLAKLG